MSILIDKIRVKNFRALHDVEVELKPITLLVGANNAGKTTLLRALNTVLGVNRSLLNKDDLFIDKDGRTLEDTIVIDIRIVPTGADGARIDNFPIQWNGILGGAEIQTDSAEKEFLAFRAKYKFDREDTPTATYELLNNWERQTVSGEFNRIRQIRESLKMYLIDAQRDLHQDLNLRTSFFGRLAAQLENDYDAEDLEKLKDLIATLNATAVSNSPVLSHLKEALSLLNKATQTRGEGVSINPIPRNIRDLHKGMKVDFQDNGSDTFSMEYHGMGTRSWASILTAAAFVDWDMRRTEEKIRSGDPSVPMFPIIALEEPEAHLHPNAQRTLYGQLKGFKGQKIISTHSPYIAGQAELDELRHFFKGEDKAEVVSLEITNLNQDERRRLKREVMLSNGELLFSKVIVLFEGETESQCLPIFAKEFWGAYPFEMGITFVAVKGNNYRPFILAAQNLNIPWFIFSDYDKQNVKRGVDNALREIGYTNPESTNYGNVIKLNSSIEQYLIGQGYQNELKTGVNNWHLTNTDESTPEQQIKAGQTRVNGLSDDDLLREISSDNGKVRYPTFWAIEISRIGDATRRIPQQIRELFEKISEKINPPKPEADETSTL
ncbi:MAG: AAA family ATPase [Saprospiraceae bacterium]